MGCLWEVQVRVMAGERSSWEISAWVAEARSQEDLGVVKGWEEEEGTQGADSGRLRVESAQQNRSQQRQEEIGQSSGRSTGAGGRVSSRGLEMRS